jgi:acetyltransferase-like isoleucine patch superfamily enzyme
MVILRSAFKRHGRNFVFDPDGYYTFNTIEVGDDVTLGVRNTLIAADSSITIGSKVMFGPHVTIVAGDHNTSIAGRFMYDIREKRPEDDQAVIIEDDVWVGANVTILKGGRLRRGCIVAAGAVVTEEIPPYTLAAGVPARVIRARFDIDTILQAEAALYPPNQRFTRDDLTQYLSPFLQLDSNASVER